MKFLLRLSETNAQGESAQAISVKFWGGGAQRLFKWRG